MENNMVEREPTPGDGSCLAHALVDQMSLDPHRTLYIIKLIHNFDCCQIIYAGCFINGYDTLVLIILVMLLMLVVLAFG